VFRTDYFADVWSSTDGRTWDCVTTSAEWGKRSQMAAAVFRDKIWLYGGTTREGDPWSNSIDLWYTTDGVHFAGRPAIDGERSIGAGASLVVHDERLWLFSGRYYRVGEVIYEVSSVWASSPDGMTWTRVVDFAPWWPLRHAQAVSCGGRLWLIGGRTAYGATSEVWSSRDGITWEPAAWGQWPARDSHTALAHRNRIWLMGGRNGPFFDNWFSDIWYSFDPLAGARSWKRYR